MPINTFPPASTGGSGTTTNALTFNNSGSGAASGTTFDGSAARTISTNTIGAYPTSNPNGYISSVAAAWPVGSVFISVSSTNPGTSLGFGTWVAFGAGRVLVGLDAGDPDFDTSEETGGAKTVASAGSVTAPTISGSTAAEASHTHGVTSNVAVADHASHNHTYTDVVNHTHPVNITDPTHNHTQNAHTHTQSVNSATTGGLSGYAPDTSTNTSTTSGYSTGSTTATNIAASTGITATTSNPAGGVASGTTAGPSATLSHSVTNNAVTSAAGSSHLHGAGSLAASAPSYTGTATSVVQPFIVVYMWKRTA